MADGKWVFTTCLFLVLFALKAHQSIVYQYDTNSRIQFVNILVN